jgi:hypothetical protein
VMVLIRAILFHRGPPLDFQKPIHPHHSVNT